MTEVSNCMLVFLFVFATMGILFFWFHFLDWIFKLGRKRAEKEQEQKKFQDKLEKLLEKLGEK